MFSGIVATLFVLVLGLQAILLLLVVRALVGPDSADPHGYTAIFGSVVLVMLVPVALALATIRGWVRRPR